MKITSIFSKLRSSDSLPQLESKSNDMDPEYEKLFPERAVFGNACRSLSFSTEQDTAKKVWLEATECSNGLWKIIKVEESPNWHNENLALGEDLRKTSHYRPHPVSFPVMLKLFGEFEHESNPFNLRVIAGQSKDNLKPLHFTVLAKQENIIFDTDGMPHPLQNGCIVSKGYFKPEDIEALRNENHNSHLSSYLKSANLITVPFGDNEDLIDQNITKHKLYMQTLLDLMKTINKGLKTRLNKSGDISYKFDSFNKFLKNAYTQSSDPDRYITCVGNPLLNARALSDKLEESISNKNLCLYFQEFQLFIGAKLLDDCLKTMKTGDRHASPDTLNKIEEFIEKTSKKYIELGGEKKTLEILLTTFLEKNHNELCDEISNSLDRNIERLDLVYDALKKRYIHSLQSKQTGNESQKISWPPSLPKNT